MKEKREGHGEDSNPLSIVKDDIFAVGVFDGMGGSGAAKCKSDYGDEHTQAYVASRIISETIISYIDRTAAKDINAEGIKKNAKSRLEQEKSTYQLKSSSLRSKLVREYPTTLAVTTALKKENEDYAIKSYWAGDSRNYLWTSDGFYQISKDDLETELDPFENLRNDAALSNCICADRDFVINETEIPNIKGKFIIISATDGCFNYFVTPMHFQDVLLTGLKKTENENEWKNYCIDEFDAVTGDDVSMSLIAVGFENFKDLKSTLGNSNVKSVDKIKDVQNEVQQRKVLLEKIIHEEWNNYKTSFLKYINKELDMSNENMTQVPSVCNKDEDDSPSFLKNMEDGKLGHNRFNKKNIKSGDAKKILRGGHFKVLVAYENCKSKTQSFENQNSEEVMDLLYRKLEKGDFMYFNILNNNSHAKR